MDVPTFYLETSVWGCLAPRQPRDRKEIVRRLLTLLDGKRGRCTSSIVVVGEILRAPAATSRAISDRMASMEVEVHPGNEEMERLAQNFLSAGVVPERRLADALHVAAATCFGDDYLISWNHRHMTRPSKRAQFEAVSRLHGFHKTPMICNPVEAIDELRGQ